MTTKAPVGPPICTRLPPNTEIKKPAIMAVNNPFSGDKPEAMAKAIARGIATIPTITPAMESEKNCFLVYPFKVVNNFGYNIKLSILKRKYNEKIPTQKSIGIFYKWSIVLLSHSITTTVPSALEGLTAVFGMGTGVAPPAKTLQKIMTTYTIKRVILLMALANGSQTIALPAYCR